MRASWLAILLYLCLLIPVTLSAQKVASAGSTTGPQGSQGGSLLQRGLVALTAGMQIADVTLSGMSTAVSPTGAQSGSITLTATAIGQEQLSFAAPDGTHTETRDFSNGGRAGRFSGPDGSGNIPPQSLPSIHPAWFFPAFVIATASSSASFAVSDVGQETRNGVAVRHLAVWLQPSGAAPSFQASLQHFTQQDLYLDPSSLLPVAMTFYARAFNPNNPDAPFRPVATAPIEVMEEVRYSDYRQVQGVPIAFHIQLFIRGALADDIQISSATINSGITIAALN